MTNIVQFTPARDKPKGEQRTIYRVSEAMYLVLCEIEAEEKAGCLGMLVVLIAERQWKALKRRGLIAHFCPRSNVDFYCLSPKGKQALKHYRRSQ